jgi:hypothetical protein
MFKSETTKMQNHSFSQIRATYILYVCIFNMLNETIKK